MLYAVRALKANSCKGTLRFSKGTLRFSIVVLREPLGFHLSLSLSLSRSLGPLSVHVFVFPQVRATRLALSCVVAHFSDAPF